MRMIALFTSPINSLTRKRDQYLISPYIITVQSHITIMRIKEMITNFLALDCFNKFAWTAPYEMYGEQYGESAFWC